MTRHYFHVSDDALRGAVAGLPDVFAAAPVAALPAPVAVAAEAVAAVPADRARAAVEAFRTACEALPGAGLSPADWCEVAGILAAVEAKRRA